MEEGEGEGGGNGGNKCFNGGVRDGSNGKGPIRTGCRDVGVGDGHERRMLGVAMS